MSWLLRYLGDDSTSPLRAERLRRSVGLFGLLLMAVTWRLWIPQTVFPQVPLVGAALGLPAWIQWLGCGGMLAGLAGALAAPGGRAAKVSLVVFAASTAAMIVADQERLQPWAYQSNWRRPPTNTFSTPAGDTTWSNEPGEIARGRGEVGGGLAGRRASIRV
jgi:hypothetical protein